MKKQLFPQLHPLFRPSSVIELQIGCGMLLLKT